MNNEQIGSDSWRITDEQWARLDDLGREDKRRRELAKNSPRRKSSDYVFSTPQPAKRRRFWKRKRKFLPYVGYFSKVDAGHNAGGEA